MKQPKMRRELKLAILSKFATQREFSKKCNIDEKRLSGICSGLNNPRSHEREAILKVLGLNDANDHLFDLK